VGRVGGRIVRPPEEGSESVGLPLHARKKAKFFTRGNYHESPGSQMGTKVVVIRRGFNPAVGKTHEWIRAVR
jgi:hypothetical protein